MAQLVVGAVGAGIGYMIGGPAGAKIGWMVGTAVGGVVFAPDAPDGPRITDKKVQSSVYGNPMPVAYGTARVNAQVVWSSELIESEQEVGGGFGKDGATQYSYSVNVLVSACESKDGYLKTPLRIWANGRLLWTNDGTPDGVCDEELIVPGNVRWYNGEGTQLPDPVYEAAVGTADAVAYRGQLTVMLEGLQLAFAGNRLPAIDVEVADATFTTACPVEPFYEATDSERYIWYGSNNLRATSTVRTAFDDETGLLYVVSSAWAENGTGMKYFDVYDGSADGPPVLVESVALPGLDEEPGIGAFGLDKINRRLWVVLGHMGPGAGMGPVAAFMDLDTRAVTYTVSQLVEWIEPAAWKCTNLLHQYSSSGEAGTGAAYGSLLHFAPDGSVSWSMFNWGIGSPLITLSGTSGPATFLETAPYPKCVDTSFQEGYGVVSSGSLGTTYIGDVLMVPPVPGGTPLSRQWVEGLQYRISHETGVVSVSQDGSAFTTVGGLSVQGVGRVAIRMSRSRRKVYFIHDNVAAWVDISATSGDPFNAVADWASISTSVDWATPEEFVWSENDNAMLALHHYTGTTTMWLFDPETDTIVGGPCAIGGWNSLVDGNIRSSHELGNNWYIGLSGSGGKVVKYQGPGATVSYEPITLGEIVSDVCVRCGLTTNQIDVTELTDLVMGYVVARPTAGRSILDQLRTGYFFDGVESATKLRFPKRGAAAVRTIDSGELGARVWSRDSEPGVALELEHKTADLDAPREVALTYVDQVANYDPGVQTARRQTTGALSVAQLELPVVFDNADEPAAIAWTQLLIAHAVKDMVQFKLTHAHEDLEPTDAVALPFADGTLRRVRILDKTTGRPLVEFTGVIEDASLYDRVWKGADRSGLPQQTEPSTLAGTLLAVLDLPPLRDVDDTLLLYTAAGPSGTGNWNGASLYKSLDGGVSYAPVFTYSVAATLGVVTAALGGWSGGNVFDRTGTMRVRLTHGTLSSATELAVLNGANVAAVGGEVIQFTTATLVGTNEWELSGLLRGRNGTEYAFDTHGAGETFVLLTDATVRLTTLQYEEVGLARKYKGVSSGQPVSDATAETVTLEGNSVRPLAPVHVRATRDLSGNITLTWVRRARVNGAWRNGMDVPLDEPAEAYEVDVYDGATVVRTLTSSSPTVGYTAAQQTTDFGSPQGSISVSVYQLSSRIGRGHAGEATV